MASLNALFKNMCSNQLRAQYFWLSMLNLKKKCSFFRNLLRPRRVLVESAACRSRHLEVDEAARHCRHLSTRREGPPRREEEKFADKLLFDKLIEE